MTGENGPGDPYESMQQLRRRQQIVGELSRVEADLADLRRMLWRFDRRRVVDEATSPTEAGDSPRTGGQGPSTKETP